MNAKQLNSIISKLSINSQDLLQKEANWIAIDSCGYIWAYKEKPTIDVRGNWYGYGTLVSVVFPHIIETFIASEELYTFS